MMMLYIMTILYEVMSETCLDSEAGLDPLSASMDFGLEELWSLLGESDTPDAQLLVFMIITVFCVFLIYIFCLLFKNVPKR